MATFFSSLRSPTLGLMTLENLVFCRLKNSSSSSPSAERLHQKPRLLGKSPSSDQSIIFLILSGQNICYFFTVVAKLSLNQKVIGAVFVAVTTNHRNLHFFTITERTICENFVMEPFHIVTLPGETLYKCVQCHLNIISISIIMHYH